MVRQTVIFHNFANMPKAVTWKCGRNVLFMKIKFPAVVYFHNQRYCKYLCTTSQHTGPENCSVKPVIIMERGFRRNICDTCLQGNGKVNPTHSIIVYGGM
jgi:hypothetical protein